MSDKKILIQMSTSLTRAVFVPSTWVHSHTIIVCLCRWQDVLIQRKETILQIISWKWCKTIFGILFTKKQQAQMHNQLDLDNNKFFNCLNQIIAKAYFYYFCEYFILHSFLPFHFSFSVGWWIGAHFFREFVKNLNRCVKLY